MTPQRHRLLFWFKVLLVTLFAMAAVTVVLRWHRIFPSHETSELYRHYENHEHIDVSFVKDFRINDTVFVDVTLLEATDSAGWSVLKKGFDIIESEDLPPEEREFLNTYFNQPIVIKKAAPGKYNQQPDTCAAHNDIIAIERAAKHVCVFHTAHSTGQRSSVEYLIDQMIINKTLNIQSHEKKH